MVADSSAVQPDSALRERVRRRLMQRVRFDREGDGSQTIRPDDGQWVPLQPRIQMKLLRREGDTASYLLRLEAGAILVPHDHPHEEECVVLEGEVELGDDWFGAGSFHRVPAGVPHRAIRARTASLLFLRGALPSAAQIRSDISIRPSGLQ